MNVMTVRRFRRAGAAAALALLVWGGPAPAAADDPFRVGVVLPRAPWDGGRGEAFFSGLQLALDPAELKEAGRAVDLVLRHSAARSEDAVTQARELIDGSKVDLLIALGDSRTGLALRDLATAERVPLVLGDAGLNSLHDDKCSPWVVTLSPANERMAGGAADWALAQPKLKRVYAVATDTPAAREIVADFRKRYEEKGGEMVGEEFISPKNRDFAAYLAKIRLIQPDAVLAVIHAGAAAPFIKDYAALGLKDTRLIAVGSLAGRVLPQGREAPGNLPATGVTPYWPAADLPANQGFREAYRTRFGREADDSAVQGFESGRLIAEAVHAVRDRGSDPLLVREALRGARIAGPRGEIRFDPRTNSARVDPLVVETHFTPDGAEGRLVEKVPPAAAASSCVIAPETVWLR